jgi:ABC-type dipeptide/oligopeptide/nickel transport system permease subunit
LIRASGRRGLVGADALLLAIPSFNILGDALRDPLDPRIRNC